MERHMRKTMRTLSFCLMPHSPKAKSQINVTPLSCKFWQVKMSEHQFAPCAAANQPAHMYTRAYLSTLAFCTHTYMQTCAGAKIYL